MRSPAAGMASSLPKTQGMCWPSGDARPSRRSSFSSIHSEATSIPGSSAAQANRSARSAFFSAATELPQPSPQTGPASLHHTRSVPIAAQVSTILLALLCDLATLHTASPRGFPSLSHHRRLGSRLPCALICMQCYKPHSNLLCRAPLHETAEGSALCRCISQVTQHPAVAVAC